MGSLKTRCGSLDFAKQGIDQMRQQFQHLTPQNQQELLSQVHVHRPGNPRSSLSGNCADIDPMGGRPTCTNGYQQIFSIQTASEKARLASKDKAHLMKIMDQMRQAAEQQQQHDQPQQKQLKQIGKRKRPSHSDTVKSPSAGSTAGLSPYFVPSTPSRALCNKMMCGALSPSFSMSGDVQIHGSDRVSGSPEILDHKHMDASFLDESVECSLSNDGDDPDMRDAPFSNLKQSSAKGNTNALNDFSFNEVGCLRLSKNKVVCCDFSSDGKILASAGHDKKVSLWNMDKFSFASTSEEHSLLITDVRFRPNSTLLATSSFDRNVQVWNATDPSHSICKLVGHTEHVMSLDFNPKKLDLLSSCDANGDIRLWDVNQQKCICVSKGVGGGAAQIRFLPRIERLLAATAGNLIRIFNVESNQIVRSLQRHEKDVRSICFDASGEYMVSVSEDRICIWPVMSGRDCIHELQSRGNKFQSCTFHPAYPLLLVVGGYQALELWSVMENRTMGCHAHKGLIASLANSPSMEMVASASYDHCVKLWK